MSISTPLELIGSIFSDMTNLYGQNMVMRHNTASAERINRQNIEYAERANNLNWQHTLEQNAYNSAASQMQRLQNAGVNLSFLGGDSVDPGSMGNITPAVVPTLSAPQAFYTPVSAFANALNGSSLREASTEKTEEETNAVRIENEIKREFGKPTAQKQLDVFDSQIKQGNQTYNLLKEQVTTQQLENARRTIENEFARPKAQAELDQLEQTLKLTKEQINDTIASAALKAMQTDELDARKAFQIMTNEFYTNNPEIFAASLTPHDLGSAFVYLASALGLVDVGNPIQPKSYDGGFQDIKSFKAENKESYVDPYDFSTPARRADLFYRNTEPDGQGGFRAKSTPKIYIGAKAVNKRYQDHTDAFKYLYKHGYKAEIDSLMQNRFTHK